MRELIVATKNKGKLREIKSLLDGMGFNVTSLADYPGAPDILEDGKSYKENALKKARVISEYTKKLVLGEDSGIEIEALGNRPGIYSARFAGEQATDNDNNKKMIRLLEGVKDNKRAARYRCYAALVDGEKIVGVVSGSCKGYITQNPRGTNGFGYDPYFLIKKYNKTFGELDPSIKSAMSHRARAFRKVKKLLEVYKL